jgi:hypothetical protein
MIAALSDPEAWGRSPKQKRNLPEGQSLIRTSGGAAAKNVQQRCRRNVK